MPGGVELWGHALADAELLEAGELAQRLGPQGLVPAQEAVPAEKARTLLTGRQGLLAPGLSYGRLAAAQLPNLVLGWGQCLLILKCIILLFAIGILKIQ